MSGPVRLLVCGSRGLPITAATVTAMRRVLSRLPAGSVVAHGGAAGADQLAGQVAAALGLAVQVFPAQWDRFGRSAGARRNAAMLRAFRPTACVAFMDRPSGTAGSRHMLTLACRAGVPSRAYTVTPGGQLCPL